MYWGHLRFYVTSLLLLCNVCIHSGLWICGLISDFHSQKKLVLSLLMSVSSYLFHWVCNIMEKIVPTDHHLQGERTSQRNVQCLWHVLEDATADPLSGIWQTWVPCPCYRQGAVLVTGDVSKRKKTGGCSQGGYNLREGPWYLAKENI